MKVKDLARALSDLDPDLEVTAFHNFRSFWQLELAGGKVLLVRAAGGLAWREAIERMNQLCRAGLFRKLPTSEVC